MGTSLKYDWTGFLHEPEPASHAAQMWVDAGELAGAAVRYLVAGLERGEPAVVIATPESWLLISTELPGAEADAVRWLDAESTLASLIVDGRPDAQRFEAVVGSALDSAAARFPGRRVRAFGEMVDLLARRGDRSGAAELEALWNGALARRGFCLLCAYQADPFAVDEQTGLLPEVCASHGRVFPSADPERFQHAVAAALGEALEPDDASRVYRAIAPAVEREPGVPVAQHALMWVSANMPARAEIVVAEARRRYRQGANGSSAG